VAGISAKFWRISWEVRQCCSWATMESRQS
jgi:hypothetical protein